MCSIVKRFRQIGRVNRNQKEAGNKVKVITHSMDNFEPLTHNWGKSICINLKRVCTDSSALLPTRRDFEKTFSALILGSVLWQGKLFGCLFLSNGTEYQNVTFRKAFQAINSFKKWCSNLFSNLLKSKKYCRKVRFNSIGRVHYTHTHTHT